MAPINGLNRVLHIFSFELNSFLRIPLIILFPRIFGLRPNFTALVKPVLPGTKDIIASLSGDAIDLYLDIYKPQGMVFVYCVAKLFISRSLVWASSSIDSV